MDQTKDISPRDRSVRFGKKVSVRRCLNLSSPSQWIKDETEKLKDDSPKSEDSGFFEPLFMETDLNDSHTNSSLGTVPDLQESVFPQPEVFQQQTIIPEPLRAYALHKCGTTTESKNRESWYSMKPALRDLFIFIIVVLGSYGLILLTNTYIGSLASVVMKSLGLVLFLYVITYFDSLKPGVVPPSPFQSGLEARSGLSMNYAMIIIYGLLFFFCNLWYQQHSDWYAATSTNAGL